MMAVINTVSSFISHKKTLVLDNLLEFKNHEFNTEVSYLFNVLTKLAKPNA